MTAVPFSGTVTAAIPGGEGWGTTEDGQSSARCFSRCNGIQTGHTRTSHTKQGSASVVHLPKLQNNAYWSGEQMLQTESSRLYQQERPHGTVLSGWRHPLLSSADMERHPCTPWQPRPWGRWPRISVFCLSSDYDLAAWTSGPRESYSNTKLLRVANKRHIPWPIWELCWLQRSTV